MHISEMGDVPPRKGKLQCHTSEFSLKNRKAVAKLEDMLHATLYSACPLGWVNMRVTREQHVPRVEETRNVCHVSQKHLRVVSEDDIKGTCRGRRYSARHVS